MAQFATVIAIKGSGTAHAVDAKGNTRVLKTGDVLQQGETVRTTGDARIELLMMDGVVMVIAPQQAVLLDAQTVQSEQRPTAQESAVARHATIDELLKALERGSDLSEELDPAAAGLGGGGGNDGGSSFVRLLRIVEPTEALQFQFGFRPPEPPPEVPRPLQTTLTIDEPQVSLSLTGAGVVADETTDLSVTRAGALVNVAVLMPDPDGGSVNVQLVIDRANSGLQTAGGHQVILVQGENDNVVLGMFDSNGDGVLDTRAFTVLITDVGVVTVTQQVALSHGDAGNVDEAVTLDGSLSVQVTATDSDGDAVSKSLPIGDRIAFRDDGPVIDVGLAQGVEISTLVTQDAETIGSAFDVAGSSASFASLFTATSSSGADQPATQSVAYSLSIGIGKEATGLTSHGQAVTLVMEGGDIVGRVSDGEGAAGVFRISVDADGDVTLTQYAQLDHLPGSLDASNDSALVRLAEGSVVLTATGTVTDADLDQATDKQSVDISGAFAFDDDIPSIDLVAVADGGITLTTQDAQTIGAASDTATASFGAAFLAAVTAGSGADAPASTAVSDYQFNLLATDSGLNSHGLDIMLAMDGADVVGSTGEGAVFRLSVDVGGNVTLTQYAQIDHLPESLDASNDNASVALAGGVITLSATATVTDFDHDQASGTLTADLGGNISFDDDIPSVNVAVVVDGGITLTTQDAQTIGVAQDTASASFAGAFLAAVTAAAGADTPLATGISGYHLELVSAAAGLGSGGLAITLAMDGADVVGRTSAGDISTDIFRLSVDTDGNVTLTQYAQIDHLPESLDTSNDNSNVMLAEGLVSLVATATVTDFDNDQATQTVTADLGGHINFDDDTPSIDVSAVADGSITLTTQDAQTIGAAQDTATAGFGAALLAAVTAGAGADAPASIDLGDYQFNVLSVNSGLSSHGQAITLAKDVNGDVVGSTGEGAVFRLSVDAGGNVTLTQYAQIDHLPESLDTSNDNASVSLANGVITLSATVAVTDFDHDQAGGTVTADLGGNISFDDDIPSIVVGTVADGSITLTTQDAQTIGVAEDSATASFAAAFLAAVTAGAGADAPASTDLGDYQFNVLSVNSGLSSHGQAITLAKDVNGDVVGSTGEGAVFRLSVDADGNVTLTQFAQIDHLPESLDASNDNASVSLASGVITLSATATATDFDHDQATQTVTADLGGNISFDDDVPSVNVAVVVDGGITLTTQDAQTIGVAQDTASASFAGAFLAAVTAGAGADAPASTDLGDYQFNVLSVNSGLSSHGQAITLAKDVNGDVVGGTGEGAVFRLSVDAGGNVTLTQYAQIDHLPESLDSINDNASVSLASGMITLSATATVTDFDHDQASGTVTADLGGNISFDDDVPSVNVAVVVDGGITLTTQDAQTIDVAQDTASASFAAAFHAAVTAGAGADTPLASGVSGYHFELLSTATGVSSGGLAITLAMDGSDVVGSTGEGAVFRLVVDTGGNVTLTQYQQIDHLPEDLDGVNDNTNLALANGVLLLSATATTTDFDNDQVTQTVTADLGGHISFDDDIPSIGVVAVADGGITLTTQDAQTLGAAQDTATANFAAAFLAAVTAGSGADAPASTAVSGYQFNLLAADSGLNSHGLDIMLAMEGADVVGSTGEGAVFRLSVDADGNVTLTQYAQIDHLPESLDSSNDNASVSLASGVISLSATATVTDFDHDQATQTVTADLGGNIRFDDDVPSVNVAVVVDGGITLTTQDAQTIGAAQDTATANFAAAFLAAVTAPAGADTPASTAVSGYQFNLLAIDSGLNSHGLDIMLAMDGADVVGSTGEGAVFRLSVDAGGNVTLTQYAQIDHLPESLDSSNDNASVSLASGVITLSATATVTDFDHDQASGTLTADLGANIRFDDDIPSVNVAVVVDGGITLTTQDAQTIGVAQDTATASFAAAFLAAVTANAGADVPGAPAVIGNYGFSIQAASSGLSSDGLAITLAMDGSDVVGRTSAGGVSTDVFRLSVDSTGTVTLTQYQHIDHLPEDVDGVNDNASVTLANGVLLLSATATATDFDNDQATQTVTADLGGNISFDDDVSSVIQPMSAYVVNQAGASGSITDVALDTDGTVDNNFGADLPGTVRFLAHAGDQAGLTTGTQAVFLYTSADGFTLLGSTLGGSSFDAAWADRATSGAFVVTLDPAGSTDSYDFQLLKPIDGGVGTFNTETGTWAFAGGNTNYVYYEDLSGQNLPSILLTPAEGTRLNGTANEIGVSGGGGGQNVGSGEAVRVDFVTNISGAPKAVNYAAPVDHAFDEHVMINGATVTFTMNTGLASSTVNFRAYDDLDTVDGVPGNEPDDVGDYQEPANTSEQVTRVTVNGTVYTSDLNVGGLGFSVDFLADGSVDISGLKDDDKVAVFTGDGFTTVEYHYVSGSTFALTGFGATTFEPGALAAMSFDLGVYDSDGDLTVVKDGLQVLLSPDDHQVVTGTSGVDNLSAPAGQPMTLVGLAGNDVLTGNTGNDILAGGQGDDVISGGAGSDTAAYLDATAGVVANLATGTATGGDGTDTLASIENLVGSRYGDTLTGDAQANTLLGGSGDDALVGAAGGDRLSGGAGSDALSGGVGDDLLKGGEGSDTLFGGAGDDTLFGASENLPDLQSDTFEWKLGDAGTTLTPAHDVVRDMHLGVGGDALDLRDLLEGEVAGTDLAAAQSLDQYLHFTEVNGKAVLEVDPDAGTASVTQSISFDNMSMNQLTASLGLANGAPDADIIREMLEQGNLKNSA